MEKTIESKTADTILQEPIKVKAGGKVYRVAPPSIATLVLVSKEISTLPKREMNEKRLMEDVLSIAQDCDAIGRIAAILVLGAKGCATRTRKVPQRKITAILGGLLHFTRTVIADEEYSPIDELAKDMMEDLSPRDMQNLIIKILQQMQIGDFFGLTTFLLEVNMTKATKVDNEATASGLL